MTARRGLVYGAVALAVLLVGAAIGMLITLSRIGPSAVPDAESVDVGFCHDMQVHHLQAVTMAGIARDRGSDPIVKQIAFDIESAQLEQVGEMRGWLISWGQPGLPDPGASHMGWMTTGGHDHLSGMPAAGAPGLMPGMASSAELAKLRSLTGAEFDVFFLQLMLRHHQGGSAMAKDGSQHASQEYVRTLAQTMVTSQGSEIRYMTALLTERGAAPLPA